MPSTILPLCLCVPSQQQMLQFWILFSECRKLLGQGGEGSSHSRAVWFCFRTVSPASAVPPSLSRNPSPLSFRFSFHSIGGVLQTGLLSQNPYRAPFPPGSHYNTLARPGQVPSISGPQFPHGMTKSCVRNNQGSGWH